MKYITITIQINNIINKICIYNTNQFILYYQLHILYLSICKYIFKLNFIFIDDTCYIKATIKQQNGRRL